MDSIRAILARFPLLSSPSLAPQAQISNQPSSITNSPLFVAAAGSFIPYDTTSRDFSPIQIKAEQKEQLLQRTLSNEENHSKVFDTKIGTTIAIEQYKDHYSLVVRIQGKIVARLQSSDNIQIGSESIITSSDDEGRIVLVRTNNTITVVDLSSQESHTFVSATNKNGCIVEGSGKFVIEQNGKTVVLYPIQELLSTKDNSQTKIELTEENLSQFECANFSISSNGGYLLIEGTDGKTYLLSLSNIDPKNRSILLAQPFDDNIGWKISEGDVLIHPEKEQSYLLPS